MIPLLAAVPVTRLRYPAPTWVEGVLVEGVPVETEIRASVQPAPDRRYEWLPEGMRSTEMLEVIAYSELRSASEQDDEQPDRIVYEGATYVVQRSTRMPPWAWQPAHWEAYATRAQPHTVTL